MDYQLPLRNRKNDVTKSNKSDHLLNIMALGALPADSSGRIGRGVDRVFFVGVDVAVILTVP